MIYNIGDMYRVQRDHNYSILKLVKITDAEGNSVGIFVNTKSGPKHLPFGLNNIVEHFPKETNPEYYL